MSVEIRYHVIRNGKEVAMYTTKKEADEHDKMLDIAEHLTDFIVQANELEIEEAMLEELSLYLAKNRLAAIQILKGGAPKPSAAKPVKTQKPAPEAKSSPQAGESESNPVKKGARPKR